MKLSQQSESLLTEVFTSIVDAFSGKEDTALTDFHFQPSSESGELSVFDDDDNELAHAAIVEWQDYEPNRFWPQVKADLLSAIAKVNKEKALENLSVWKPYSFVLVDDERETICDLLLVDDDMLVLSDNLLEGLDADLDNFLEHLLED